MQAVSRTTPASPWQDTWRYVAGVGACLLLGYFAFVRGARVPLLGWVDLGFHELGHFVMYPLPVGDFVTAVMGSCFQVVIPLGLAVYFFWRRDDLLAAGLCLAWTGTSLADVSVYVADAPYQRLPLLGGDASTHDWAYLLGPEQLDMIDSAAGLAAAAKGIGAVLLLGGIALCLWGALADKRAKPSERYAQSSFANRDVPVELVASRPPDRQSGDIIGSDR